ncbi:MAG: hypothetical protein KAF27_12095 [Porphyrobacter sp.]|nr:hypothetical protein [Porphyrobacter sp.]
MDLLLQTGGSLIAILALAGLAWWLKLGPVPQLDSDEAVRRAAAEVEDGFEPVAITHDSKAALARNGAGQIMVIKRHGNRFAGRLLGPGARARLWRDLGQTAIEVDPGERRFGKVFIDIPDAEAWADAINEINGPRHA